MLDRDWIFGFCLRWIFAAIALFILSQLLLAPNLASFNCVRAEPSRFQCELSSSGLFGTYKTEISSEQVRSIEIDSECHYPEHSSRKKCNHSIIIRTTNGKIPLSYNPYSEKSDAQTIKDRIDTFLRNREQKLLTIEKDDRGLITSIIIVLPPGILILMAWLGLIPMKLAMCLFLLFMLALFLIPLGSLTITPFIINFLINIIPISTIALTLGIILKKFVPASPSNEFGADNNSSPEENID